MKKPELKKILYLPVEHVQRELDGKLLVAIEAASRGYAVIIGRHTLFSELKQQMLPGVFLYKDMASWQAEKDFPVLKNRGFRVFALDEEGIIFASPEVYVKNRVSHKAISFSDKIFAWGTYQANVLIEFAKVLEEKIKIVGNPRIDLIRLQNGVKKTKNDKFTILINTRFASVNGYRNYDSRVQNLRRLGLIKTQADIDTSKPRLEREQYLFDSFISLIGLICTEFSSCKVIVRPHPGESEIKYLALTHKHQNLVVDKAPPLSKQLTESSVMIHESCTTAIEANLSNIPVISFVPSEPLSKFASISNEFGMIFKTAEEVIQQIHTIKNSNVQNNFPHPEKLKSYIENSDGEYSFRKIVDEFDKYSLESFNIDDVLHRLKKNQISIGKMKSVLKKIIHKFPKTMALLLGKSKVQLALDGFEIEQKSFPDFDAEYILKRIKSISCLLPNHSDQLEVSKIVTRLYLINANSV